MTRSILIRILLVVVAVAAFYRVCGGDFSAWDDERTIAYNPHLSPPKTDIGWFWQHSHMDLYIPITYSVWGAIVRLATLPTPDARDIHLNPFVFHTANLIVHLLAILLVWSILRRLLRSLAAPGVVDWAAAGGAALFALHPVQVEAVAWISGMKDLLAGLFSLLALLLYLRWVDSTESIPSIGVPPVETDIPPTARLAASAVKGGVSPSIAIAPDLNQSPPWFYLLATACFVLALLSKPTAAVLPLAIIVIDGIILRGRPRRWLSAMGVWLAIAFLVVWVGHLAQPSLHMTQTALWTRPLIAADALAFYLYKLLLPMWLTFDYERSPRFVLSSKDLYWTWAIPVGVAVLILAWRGGRRWLGAAALLFLVTLLPVLGLVPFEFERLSTVADHYLYLAMLGPTLALAWVLARYRSMILRVLVVVALLLFGIGTWMQTEFWHDDIQLFSHAIFMRPRSFPAHHDLGYALLEAARADRVMGKTDQARERLKQSEAELYKAVTLDPEDIQARENFVNVLLEQGKDGAVIKILSPLLPGSGKYLSDARKRYYAPLYETMGRLMMKHGRFGDAVGCFQELHRQDPQDPQIALYLKSAKEALSQSTSRNSLGPS